MCKGIWLKPNLRERKADGGETVELCPECIDKLEGRPCTTLILEPPKPS